MWKFTLWGRSCQPADRSIYLNEMWLSSSSLNIFYTINNDNFTRHFASNKWDRERANKRTNRRNPSKQMVIVYERSYDRKRSREKRNAADNMQKENDCCCCCWWWFWRTRAMSSCTVQIAAWSNRILCNFLIFCIASLYFFLSYVLNSALLLDTAKFPDLRSSFVTDFKEEKKNCRWYDAQSRTATYGID